MDSGTRNGPVLTGGYPPETAKNLVYRHTVTISIRLPWVVLQERKRHIYVCLGGSAPRSSLTLFRRLQKIESQCVQDGAVVIKLCKVKN